MYRIEPMSIDDFEEVTRLWQNTEGVGLNEADSKENITRFLERNPGMSFVAREGKEIVGAVLCGNDGRRGYLHHLAVATAHRNKGIAKRLTAAACAEVARANITRCNIYIFAENDSGAKFWERQGWTKRDDMMVMQKALTNDAAEQIQLRAEHRRT